MNNLKEYALEDDYDDLIEESANLMDDNIHIEEGDDFTAELYQETEQEDAEFDLFRADSQHDNTVSNNETIDGSLYKTYDNVFSDGKTTYRSDGSVYKTYDNVFSDGKTTYGSDGVTYKTCNNVFSDGKTTYGSNGVTYKTEKKLFGSGTVTYGSDGSKFESID